MPSQFDKRIHRLITVDKRGSQESYEVVPFTWNGDTNAYSEIPLISRLKRDVDIAKGKNDADAIQATQNALDRGVELLKEYEKNPDYHVVPSIMNPYAMVRLYGAKGGDYLTDSASTRKYYEIDGPDSDQRGGYAKNPTTANIINWGNSDAYSRTPYQYQDFVFCKYWNKIPNNRLITLRRYPLPILDNLNFPTMDKADGKPDRNMHPVATLVSFFGGDTENKLSDILSFTSGLEWEEIQADVWSVGSQTEGMDETLSMFGSNNWISQHSRALVDVMGILNPQDFNPRQADGLPPDPYSDGPYQNRVIGPVNVIDKTMKRKRGLKFSMDNLSLKFHYVARPIGNINSKAALLDILGNVLTMSTASAQFFGGAHKFMIQPNRYPFNNSSFFRKMYNGQLWAIVGKDGKRTPGAGEELATIFSSKFAHQDALGYRIGDVGKTLLGAMKDILGDAWSTISSVASNLLAGNSPFQGLRDRTTEDQSAATTSMLRVLGNEMRSNVGTVPYLTGMRSLFTGEPVGDWHLTIGNPLNPIAMIGNLVCDSVEINWDDELGPDDFPIGFTATITLKHGMPRDRDAIESIFNRGAGRIYEISDEMQTSADGQTAVDDVTKADRGSNNADMSRVIDGRGSRGGMAIRDLRIREGYKSSGTTLRLSNQSSENDLNTIEDLKNAAGGNGLSTHILAPWAIKNIM